jgi:NADPH:quinone reductase-like Zn-dependent oxidoreductase
MASIVAIAVDFDEALDKNISLYGILLNPASSRLEQLGAMIVAGELVPRVGRSLRLDKANQAHELAEAGSVDGRIVLTIG